MNDNVKALWRIRAAVVGLFLLGCLAGALGMNIYRTHFTRSPREFRGERFEQMMNRLNLTDDQKTQVEQIVKDSRSRILELRRQAAPQYQEIRRSTDSRLQAVLTPQQWERWRQMTQEMRRRRGRAGDRR